ncbi:MAG: methionine synthase [Spirochaetae bacterium HGW-Spirochaetae-8]|nr:MAG: methionine synthase [Spirochaetae bacterium HGW-Spirochaetae-8]
MTRSTYLMELAARKILVLDGAMGTMIQQLGFGKEDFSLDSLLEDCDGQRYAPGCNDLLSITRPEAIYEIHQAYIAAGADIIETNTFGANRFSLEEYGLAEHVYDLNLASVEVARMAVEEAERADESRFVFIAGVVGPTGKSASFSPSVDDPALRDADFHAFIAIYREQITALLDARVDVLLIETVFDTLVAKAALSAAVQLFSERGESVPLMVSATFSDGSRRTLSGQTLEAFIISLLGFPLFSLGVNCSTGAAQMVPLIRELAEASPFLTSAHPNAGFPNQEGIYEQTPEEFTALLAPVLQEGCLSIVGGCCGTTPAHIEALAKVAAACKPHQVPMIQKALRLSGWEPLVVSQEHQFITIGERANVAGSRKFARLIKEGKYDQALSVARSQVEQGAQIIDICMDDAMLDAPLAMVRFLRLAAADPMIARVPVMVDSSSWEVVQVALAELQGRGIVNSISLKEGEEPFLQKAQFVARMGAAVVVMLFDEQGQADTFERKCTVAERSYRLLVDSGIFKPESIVFDPNILSIATGIDEHDFYARDFIRAVRWIKQQFPLVKTSGGLSNLSFSFRGNNALREAIHAVFLNLAVEAGLDMAIVNPAMSFVADDVPQDARAIIREALLVEEGDGLAARNALVELALSQSLAILGEESSSRNPLVDAWRSLPVKERLAEAILRGDDSHLEQDLMAAGDEDAVALIEGPLMGGMSHVGELFGEGRLFLPQVVRSARIMKKAVDFLQPRLELAATQVSRSAGTIVLATVKGDVHDIGKNIVSLVLRCNNFKVVDLGVMVPAETIAQAVLDEHADMVGLSGLITPSLVEMAQVCRLFQQKGINIPVLIGGATTSEEHTAVKLFPLYANGVIHTKDASHTVMVALQLVSTQKTSFMESTAARYLALASRPKDAAVGTLDMQAARQRRYRKEKPAPMPLSFGIHTIEQPPLQELLKLVNWRMFAAAWRVSPNSAEAMKLEEDTRLLLERADVRSTFEASSRAVVGVFPACSLFEEVKVFEPTGRRILETLRFLRMQQVVSDQNALCLADFIVAGNLTPTDAVGLFAATAGIGVAPLVRELKNSGDEYGSLLVAMLADRLAEALSGYLHAKMASDWWGYGDTPSIRPAPGYPSAPDHAEKQKIFTLLQATERTGMVLTDHYAMDPAASVCGYYFVGEGCRYFSVGAIGQDQLSAYAQATGRETSELSDALVIGS